MSERWKTRKSLILRARNPDDSQAWEDFVQYYERFIFHVLHRMNVSVNDLDDLVQNVLVKLWRSLASYESGKARFRTWLGVVVRNAVYDQFSETNRQRKLLQHELESLQMLEKEPASEIEQLIEKEWADYVTSIAMARIEKLFSEEAVKSAVELRAEFAGYILETAKQSAKTGEPILRPLEYDFPGMQFETLKTQFMLGTDLLVAPVLQPNARQRLVQIPPGTWQSSDGTKVQGPTSITVVADLDELPYFRKVVDKE